MTIDKPELLERLRRSLEEANIALNLKQKIEESILDVVNLIKEVIGEGVVFSIDINRSSAGVYRECEKLMIMAKNTGDIFDERLTLFGFSLAESTSFPVFVETDMESLIANNDDELRNIVASIIEQNSLKIMKFISEKGIPDPF